MKFALLVAGLLTACGPMVVNESQDASIGVDVAAADGAVGDVVSDDGTNSDASDFAQVATILRTRCSGYCHAGGVDIGASLIFELPDGGLTDLTQQPSREVPRMRIVVPGDPTASYLMIKLDDAMPTLPECAGDAGACGVAMPWTSTRPPAMLLPDNDRALIRRWIAAGAPTDAR